MKSVGIASADSPTNRLITPARLYAPGRTLALRLPDAPDSIKSAMPAARRQQIPIITRLLCLREEAIIAFLIGVHLGRPEMRRRSDAALRCLGCRADVGGWCRRGPRAKRVRVRTGLCAAPRAVSAAGSA